MHSSGSIIKTYCEKVRHYLDDPDIDAKYDDNYLVRFFLSSAMSDVIGRVSMMADNQIICMLTISVVNGTTYYKLPPSVKQVLRIGVQDPNTGWFTEDFRPRNEFHLAGPGWALEGNLLAFRPTPSEAKNYLVMYVPSGDIAAHHGTLGTINANGTFTLGTPNIGSLDKRDNAYAGSYIRILGANITDELIITSHDPVTGIMTLRNPPANAAGTYTYEVIPFLMEPMTDAIAISAAMRAGVGRKINQVTMQNLALAYKQAIKTSHDTIGNMNSRIGKRFTGTIDPVGGYTIGTSGSAATTGTCAPCGAAGGDLGGTYPNPTVDGLQGRSVASTAPTNGQALVWNSSTSSWGPATVSGGGGSGTVTSITPAADSGTGTAITTSGTITVAGTANEVETSVSGTTVTVGLPSAITVTEVNVDLLDLNTGVVSPTDAVGRQYWDSTYNTVSLGLSANVNLKQGQALYKRARNDEAFQINKGQVVYVSGSHAATEAKVKLADADLESTSANTIGVAAEDIPSNTTGLIQVFGYLTGLTTNTAAYPTTEGDPFYLSTTAGATTPTLPAAPKHGIRVGFLVKRAGAGSGSIFVNIQNYQELEELSDVLIGTKAEQDLLSWDNTAGVWKNRTIANAGVAAASHTHNGADIVSGTVGITYLPTGTSGTTVCIGNDSRLSDARTPTAHKTTHATGGTDALAPSDIGAVPTSRTVSAGTGLTGGGDLSANRTISASFGTTAGSIAEGNHTHAASGITSGTFDIARIPQPGVLVPASMYMTWSDFVGSSTLPWSNGTANTGSVSYTGNGGEDNPGIVILSTGTNAAGRAYVGSNQQDAFIVGGRKHVFSTSVQPISNLSSSADRYSIEAGFFDNLTGVTTYSAYFAYTDNVNTGQFVCITSDGVSSKTTNTTVAPSTTVFRRLDIEFGTGGTSASVVFKIDGTTVATHTGTADSVPSGSTNRLGVAVNMRKNGGTVGTSLRQLRVDYLLHWAEVVR